MFVPQNTFSGGEVSEDVYGRVDLAKYYTGLKTVKNMILHPQGGLSNAPGTMFVGDAVTDVSVIRLVQFVFSTDQSLVMVFSDRLIQFVFDGGFVIDPQTSQRYEVVTPYLETELWDLSFNQSGDVVIITNNILEIPPQILSRFGNVDWTIADINFIPELDPPTGLSLTVDSGGTGKEWSYKVTAVSPDADESRGSTAATVDGPLDSTPDKLVSVTWNAVPGAERYFVYKKSGGSFGYVGQSATTSFDDDFIAPSQAKTPPDRQDPFEFEENGQTVNYYPAISYFYQQRLGFSNTLNRPQDIWFSKSSNYYNFDTSSPLVATDSINLTIATNRIDEILHVVSLGDIVILTAGSEWRLDVTGGISPTSLPSAIPQSYIGSSKTPPLIIGNSIINVQRNERTIREMTYSFENSGYNSSPLNLLAPHLFENDEVREMAFAQEPYSIIWVVMKSGRLLGFTYMKEQDVWGWHQHETDGYYESVCALPGTGNTDIYFVVKRFVDGRSVKYIERLQPRIVNEDVKESFFVHSGLVYRSYAGNYTGTGSYEGVSYALNFTIDDSFNITGTYFAGGSVLSFILSSELGGGSWTIEGSVDEYGTMTFNTATEVSQGRGVLYFNGTVNSAFEASGTSGSGTSITNDESGVWSATNQTPEDAVVSELFGLDHLEGKDVTIFSDGSVEPLQTVVNGEISLEIPSSHVVVGLPYESEMETLSINLGNEQQTTQHSTVNIPRATILFKDTVSAFVGSSEEEIYEMRFRTDEMGEDPIPLYTGKKEITIGSGFNDSGRVIVKQTYPLPITVLSIMPDAEMGE